MAHEKEVLRPLVREWDAPQRQCARLQAAAAAAVRHAEARRAHRAELERRVTLAHGAQGHGKGRKQRVAGTV